MAVAEFWRPSIDPLQELQEHAEALTNHQHKLLELIETINHQTRAIQKIAQDNHELRLQIKKLQSHLHAATYSRTDPTQ